MRTNTPTTEPQPTTWFRKVFTENVPKTSLAGILSALTIIAIVHAGEPAKGATKQVDLGGGVTLEVVYIPPGEFMIGSTSKEREWATGPEGGTGRAAGGDGRERYEGDPRRTRIKDGFWMGRTELTVGQWRRFVEETGYITDAEKGALAAWFDWKAKKWQMAGGKGWRDPSYGFPVQDNHPVACVSWNDARAFCQWLTKKERAAGRLPDGHEYRLPAEAEWEYACRGGRTSTIFWWGNDLKDGAGRLNIATDDPLPGNKEILPSQKAPWRDGFVMVSPVDHYGEKGRNGFGLADMLGNVWEICLDHFDPQGAHEEVYFVEKDPHPVCRGVSFMARPGAARCAVRLGLSSPSYSDSRDGFRLCLGARRGEPVRVAIDDFDLGAMVQPFSETNVFRLPDHDVWDGPVCDFGDGKYYMVYSRWPKCAKEIGWLTDSEIAIAVSDRPTGPYRHVKVLLGGAGPGHWDELMAHNPKLERFGDKYYLYYNSSRQGPTRGHIRDSQRIGVAVADSVLGAYRRSERPLIEPVPPAYNVSVDSGITETPNGKFLMIFKADIKPKRPTDPIPQRIQALAIADAPDGPFRVLPDPAFDDFDTEDASIWYDRQRKRFYAIFHAYKYIGLITSEDGRDWRKAVHHVVIAGNTIRRADGTFLQTKEPLQRPYVFFKNGQARILTLSVPVPGDWHIVHLPLASH